MFRETSSLHFENAWSSGKTTNRNILCLHNLSTLCPIDFEPRLTLGPAHGRRHGAGIGSSVGERVGVGVGVGVGAGVGVGVGSGVGVSVEMRAHGPTSVSSALF
jgi:hypothetical protein